jgi:hypothetical protein
MVWSIKWAPPAALKKARTPPRLQGPTIEDVVTAPTSARAEGEAHHERDAQSHNEAARQLCRTKDEPSMSLSGGLVREARGHPC